MSKERIGGLVFLCVGIYGLISIFLTQIPLGELQEPGPGAFPFVLSALLSISGVLWLILGKSKEGAGEKKSAEPEAGRKERTPLKIVGLTLAFILVLNHMGYLLTSFVYLFFLFFWVSRYRAGLSLGFALGLAVLTWYCFAKLLLVQLPRGILPL